MTHQHHPQPHQTPPLKYTPYTITRQQLWRRWCHTNSTDDSLSWSGVFAVYQELGSRLEVIKAVLLLAQRAILVPGVPILTGNRQQAGHQGMTLYSEDGGGRQGTTLYSKEWGGRQGMTLYSEVGGGRQGMTLYSYDWGGCQGMTLYSEDEADIKE